MNGFLALGRNTVVWIILVLFSFASFTVLPSAWLHEDNHWTAIAVIAIAFFKVRMIGLEYMELRKAPLPLRLCYESWVITFTFLLIWLY